ncbi:MAG: SpoIIE family protein phosphatase [Desulfobacteraceae bacterium]|nr:SpoIIE family protein phosphatase [Desulfobacteraceae bacterium]
MKYKNHQKKSIGRRFSRVLISVVLLIFSVFSVIIITYNVNRVDQYLDERLDSILKLSEITMGAAVWQLHHDYLQQCANSVLLQDVIVYIGLLDDMKKPLLTKARPVFQQKPFSFFQKSRRFKARESDIMYNGEKIGFVQIAVSRESIYKELLLNTSIAIAVITLLIIAIVITVISTTRRHIIRPLLKLKDSAELIAGGDLDAFIDKSHEDEIGTLAEDFDIMRKSIKHLFEDLKNANVQLEDYARTLEHKVEQRTRTLAETLKEVEYANRMIIQSIRYAEKIQSSLLPAKDTMDQCFEDYFVIWEPCEIVGGDIYLFEVFQDGYLVAVIDCTGHGVPGAFMTMIAGTVFKRVVSRDICHDPAKILKMLNAGVKKSLYEKENRSASDDGMDAGICFVNTKKRMVTYAGARIPLVYITREKLKMIKGDRQSIGYKKANIDYEFTNHQLPTEPGMMFYLSSDGYTGQTGGPKDLSIGKKRWKALLQEICYSPFEEQKKRLIEYLYEWKGDQSLKDDITLVGFGFHQD